MCLAQCRKSLRVPSVSKWTLHMMHPKLRQRVLGLLEPVSVSVSALHIIRVNVLVELKSLLFLLQVWRVESPLTSRFTPKEQEKRHWMCSSLVQTEHNLSKTLRSSTIMITPTLSSTRQFNR